MSVEERYKLLWHLLDNLASEKTVVSEPPEWHDVILDKIMKKHEKNPDNVLSRDEVFAQIQRRK